MIYSRFRKALLIVAAIAVAAPVPASADTPADLRDLIGVRGSSSDAELQRRGYTLGKSTDIAGYWWNASRKTCVSVVVDDGRVQEINTEASVQCGKNSSGSGSAAAGVAIGALLLGAIAVAASKHDKHDDDDRDRHHDGHSYSPYAGVICYKRESACYEDGRFSSYWSRKEF